MIKTNAVALALTLILGPLAAAPAFAQAPVSMARAPTDAEVAAYARSLLDSSYRADGPGVAVLVARGDKVIFRGARGEADVDGHKALAAGDVFRIGSVTKQFAAAGVLKLVEESKVGLDDPLSKYVPGYPGGDRITVRMLLNHTSGIKSYTGMPGYMVEPIKRDLTTAQMIEVFKDQPADFAPGEKFAYNNSGYVLVGAVIEAASGMAWYDYLDKVFFRPLGMTGTGYGADPKWAARQVKGYTLRDGKVAPMAILSMTQPHAAGALVSTADDLLKWNRALHEGRVLKSETYKAMITPIGAAADAKYGFGLFADEQRGAPTLQHSGGIFGFVSQLTYVPGPDITVVILQNTDGGGDPGALARRLVAEALGKPYPAAQAIPIAPAALQAAEGVYRFDEKTARVLRVVDGKLTAQRIGGQRSGLIPIGQDDFLYEDGFNRLELVRDAKGAVSGMRFFPMGDGPGLVGARTGEPLPEAPQAAALPRAALERVVGVYTLEETELKVFLDGERLKAQLTGQDPVTLRPAADGLFEVDELSASLAFPAGPAPGQLTLRQNGQEIVFTRKP